MKTKEKESGVPRYPTITLEDVKHLGLREQLEALSKEEDALDNPTERLHLLGYNAQYQLYRLVPSLRKVIVGPGNLVALASLKGQPANPEFELLMECFEQADFL
jgi:hypothetical protein